MRIVFQVSSKKVFNTINKKIEKLLPHVELTPSFDLQINKYK